MFEDYILSPLLFSLSKFRDRKAFCINKSHYSYGDFAEEISRIRGGIRGLKPGSSNVGLVVNDDLPTYASVIALWLEGLAYVPIHPRYPVERGIEIVRQADIDLILDSSPSSVFNIGRLALSNRFVFTGLNLEPRLAGEDENAYILFTSGSTGRPKGVPISRKNLGAFMKAFSETGIDLGESDRCLQCFDLTFDVSVQSFVFPLTKGACVYTIPHNQLKPGYAYDLMEEHGITFGAMAPSMLRFLRPYFAEIHLPHMRYNILTAEASPLELVEEWSGCIPDAEIFDFYGPTESTIYCTYYSFLRHGKNKSENGMLAIGKPMSGVFAIVIDSDGNILPHHEKGELCIAGDQLSSGYLGDEVKNKASFFDLDYPDKVRRYYRTGDLCYIDDDGDIIYSGRLDYQVKIQGFRVELGEIEHIARKYLGKGNVVAVTVEANTGLVEMVLFVEGESIDTDSMLDFLRSRLPYYMVPARVLIRKELPLNSNGKIDRNVLKNSL